MLTIWRDPWNRRWPKACYVRKGVTETRGRVTDAAQWSER